jgi:hypothetical protein
MLRFGLFLYRRFLAFFVEASSLKPEGQLCLNVSTYFVFEKWMVTCS